MLRMCAFEPIVSIYRLGGSDGDGQSGVSYLSPTRCDVMQVRLYSSLGDADRHGIR